MGTTLILGTESPVGAAVADVLSRESQIIGRTITSSRIAENFSSGRITPGDVPHLVAQADRVVYCGAAAASSWEPSFGAGLVGEQRIMRSIASACAAEEVPLTLVSSDAVYEGPWMFCDENTVPNGSTPISRQVARAECDLLEACPTALIVRTNAVALTTQGDSVFDQMLDPATSSRPRTAPADGFSTPITADRFALALAKAHDAGVTGFLHLAGAERTTAWQLAVAIARETGLPMPRPDHGVAANTPIERSLRCSLARQTANFVPPMLNELVAELVASAEKTAAPQRTAA